MRTSKTQQPFPEPPRVQLPAAWALILAMLCGCASGRAGSLREPESPGRQSSGGSAPAMSEPDIASLGFERPRLLSMELDGVAPAERVVVDLPERGDTSTVVVFRRDDGVWRELTRREFAGRIVNARPVNWTQADRDELRVEIDEEEGSLLVDAYRGSRTTHVFGVSDGHLESHLRCQVRRREWESHPNTFVWWGVSGVDLIITASGGFPKRLEVEAHHGGGSDVLDDPVSTQRIESDHIDFVGGHYRSTLCR